MRSRSVWLRLAAYSKCAAEMAENIPAICTVVCVNDKRGPNPHCNPTAPSRPVEEVCIEVPCGDDTEAACDDLIAYAETVITSIGAPFVPIKNDGVIYIRPPLS